MSVWSRIVPFVLLLLGVLYIPGYLELVCKEIGNWEGG